MIGLEAPLHIAAFCEISIAEAVDENMMGYKKLLLTSSLIFAECLAAYGSL